MLGLIYKDFLIMKKEILSNLLSVVLWTLPMFFPWQKMMEDNGMMTETINGETMTFVLVPLVSYFFTFIVLSGIQSNIFACDEKKMYSAFISSTPLTAKGQVLSKYYETLLISFIGVILGMFCDMISSLVHGEIGSAMTIYLSMFFVQIFLRAIDMPFIIRFGQKYGKNVKLIIIAVVAFGAIVYGLFGKLPDTDGGSLIDAVLLWFVTGNNLSTMMLGFVAIFPYVAFGAFYLSYRISVKMYRKGAENYEC